MEPNLPPRRTLIVEEKEGIEFGVVDCFKPDDIARFYPKNLKQGIREFCLYCSLWGVAHYLNHVFYDFVKETDDTDDGLLKKLFGSLGTEADEKFLRNWEAATDYIVNGVGFGRIEGGLARWHEASDLKLRVAELAEIAKEYMED